MARSTPPRLGRRHEKPPMCHCSVDDRGERGNHGDGRSCYSHTPARPDEAVEIPVATKGKVGFGSRPLVGGGDGSESVLMARPRPSTGARCECGNLRIRGSAARIFPADQGWYSRLCWPPKVANHAEVVRMNGRRNHDKHRKRKQCAGLMPSPRHRLQAVEHYEYTNAGTLLADFWEAVFAFLREET